ncbi:hypothetical protein [Chitinophaga sp.]|uniref:hypothetical protein n=1 Tax=Chitinophaga sp. TaxID=1869181 RepID=UPI0031DA7199
MKKIVMPLLALVVSVSAASAQTAKDVFDRSVKLTYLGLDFTKARIVGDAAAKVDEIIDNHYPNINQKVVNEAKKFDIAGAFRREEVSTDIGPVNKRNAKIDPDNVKSDNSDDYQAMKPEDVAALVKGFDFAGKSGIGILIVMDGMNKTKKEISGYVTLVDMKAKKVLFTERVEGGLGMGFGYTNVYLTGIKKMIDAIEKKKYTEWKSTYGG